MIEQYSGKIELVCDECGEISGQIEASGHADILRQDAKRDHGWRRFQRDSKWFDTCGDCVAKWAGRQRRQGGLI